MDVDVLILVSSLKGRTVEHAGLEGIFGGETCTSGSKLLHTSGKRQCARPVSAIAHFTRFYRNF